MAWRRLAPKLQGLNSVTMRSIVALAVVTAVLFAASASAQGLSTTILVSCRLPVIPIAGREKSSRQHVHGLAVYSCRMSMQEASVGRTRYLRIMHSKGCMLHVRCGVSVQSNPVMQEVFEPHLVVLWRLCAVYRCAYRNSVSECDGSLASPSPTTRPSVPTPPSSQLT